LQTSSYEQPKYPHFLTTRQCTVETSEAFPAALQTAAEENGAAGAGPVETKVTATSANKNVLSLRMDCLNNFRSRLVRERFEL